MMKLLFLVYLICFGIESSLGALCDFAQPQVSLSLQVLEYAPVGQEIYTVDVVGIPETEIRLTLEGQVSTYFEMQNKTLIKSEGENLTRSDPLISGNIICTTVVGSITENKEVFIVVNNINNVNPVEFTQKVYNESLSEFSSVDSVIEVTAQDNDVADITYKIIDETPPGYYELAFSTQGSLLLIRKLDYEKYPKISLTIQATSNGVDEENNPWQDTAKTTVEVNVVDEDDNPPQFSPCTTVMEGLCVPPLYTSSVNKSEMNELHIKPGPISAKDLDTGINADIEYTFASGIHDAYFTIDLNDGTVTMIKEVTDSSLNQFTIPVVATEKAAGPGETGRSIITYLIVDVITVDSFKPTFSESSYNGYIQQSSIGSLSYVTEDENGTIPLRLNVTDEDDPTAQFVYEVNSPYQVSSDGLVYYSPTSRSTFITISDAQITAVNLNADLTSKNRKSEPVTLTVNVVIPATTPEPTTMEPTTLEPTTLEPTTPEPTTPEPTTPEPTTLEPTTPERTTPEPTTLEPTTLEPTTPEPTTLESTTPELTTLESTTLEPTTPEPTTLEPTTPEPTTPEPTTPEPTTLEPTTLEPTTPEPTTLEPTTLEPTTPELTTLESTTPEPTTSGPTTSESTTPGPTTLESSTTGTFTTNEITSSPTLASTPQTNIPSEPSTPQTITTTATTLSALNTTSTSTTNTQPFTSTTDSGSSVAFTEDVSQSITTPSTIYADISTVAYSPTSSIMQDTSPTSTNSVPTDGCPTCTESTTPEGVVILPPGTYVASSLLYGVAGGLGAALLICLLIIAFLLYKRYTATKHVKPDSSPSVTHHDNGAFEDEVSTSGQIVPQQDSTYAMANDVEPKVVTFQDDDSGTEVNEYEKTDSLSESEKDEVADESETEETEPSPFAIEIKQSAASLAATAAVAAATTDNELKVAAVPAIDEDALQDYGSAYKKKQVRIEKILTEGHYGQTRLVTIENYGLERHDVKAVARTIKIDLAPGTYTSSCQAQIRLMMKACEQEHENILQYCGMHEDSSELHCALTYASNGSLENYFKTGLGKPKLDAFQMMNILSGVGKGLQYLHAKNIVHCNLQPRSVMLDEDLTPKLRDYENNEVSFLKDGDSRVRWQALEVLNGDLSNAASDIWSYGVVMWHVASRGAMPYSHLSEKDIMDHLNQNYRPIKPNGCSQSLFSVMESCWNTEPRSRPDIYVIVANLDEKLTEDANDLIGLGVDLAPSDVQITVEDSNSSSLYPVLPNPLENVEEDYTMF